MSNNSHSPDTDNQNSDRKGVMFSPYTHGLLKYLKKVFRKKYQRIFGSIDELIIFIIKDIVKYNTSEYDKEFKKTNTEKEQI